MTFKGFAIIGVLLAVSFAVGRYTVPKSVTTEVKQTVVEKENKNINQKVDTTKTETDKPDGTKTIVTISHVNTTDKSTTKNAEKTDSKTVTVSQSNHLIIEGLVGLDVTNSTGLIYGAQISNNLIGPVRIGIFGFTDGKFGVSLGLQF